MRIVIDIGPIDSNSTSAHKVRGVGKYITLLKDNIEKIDQKNTYVFSSTPDKEKDVDLIHYPYFDPFFITLPLIKKNKCLVTVHDVIPLTHKQQFPVGIRGEIKWRLNKMRLKRADGIITDSYASKQEIGKITGISDKKIFPVHLAVENEFKETDLNNNSKSELQEKYHLPKSFVLYVGDITWNKNLPNIVKAVKKANIPLVMVGKAVAEELFDSRSPWNASRKIVLEETYGNSLFNKVGFVPMDDLVGLYNLAQALIMPSFDEGFGLPVLEAMKSGCPVITSNCGSLPEVAGDAGLYVDPESYESISRAIGSVVNSSDLREELSKKGLAQAKKFSIEKMMKDTIVVYESLYHEK